MERLISYEEFLSCTDVSNVKNEWVQNNIKEILDLAKDVNMVHAVKRMIKLQVCEGTTNYEHGYVYLKHPTLNLRVSIEKKNSKKHYTIICEDMAKLTNNGRIGFSDRQRVAETIPTPKNIGVLTQKKVAEWVTYYEQVYAATCKEVEVIEKKVQEFKDLLKTLPVVWYSQNKGYVEKGGLIYSFSIEDGVISQKIEVSRSILSTLENFIQMSDNKLPSR